MNIYLLRHGTTEWNTSFRIQGQTDIPLDAEGERIARITGESLAAEGIIFSHVFSSPLRRAYRTAQLAAPYAEIITDPRITELNFGTFEGLSVQKMLQDESCAFRFFRSDPFRYNEEILQLKAADPDSTYESLPALCARTENFLEEMVAPLVRTESAGTNILISGHGAMNRGLMMRFTNSKDLRTFWGRGLQANCGIFIINASVSASGEVVYQTDEKCRIWYDDSKEHIPALL